jgi:hypothetical protein
MSFCNNSKLPAITPTVKRGAPAIPLEEFNNILTDYYNMGIGSGDLLDYYKEASEKETFIKNIFKRRIQFDSPGFYSELKFISDDPETTEIKAIDPEACLLGLHVLDSGIPIYGFLLGGENEKPFFALIYWNGDHLRLFIPKYGNTINIDFFTGFGSEAYSTVEDPEKLVEEYEDFLHESLDDITCSACPAKDIEFMAPGIAYCLKNVFAKTEDEAYEVMNTVSWEIILDEINDILEEADEDLSEERYIRYIDDEDDDEDDVEDDDDFFDPTWYEEW